MTSFTTGHVTLCVLSLLSTTSITGQVFTGELPKFMEEPESVVVRPRSKVVLRCQVSPPSARIRWKFNGDFIGTNYEEGIIINDGGDLVIRSFRHSKKHRPHAGRYQCVASTPSGAIASRSAEVSKAFIKEFPRSAVNRVTVEVPRGNTALIKCTPPVSQPRSEVSFLVNKTIVQDGHTERHTILPSGNLQISQVRNIDQGDYECQAYNAVREQYRTSDQIVTLRVIEPSAVLQPARTVYALASVDAVTGTNVTLECLATGNPTPSISWSMFGGELPKGRSERHLGNLVLVDVRMEDTGTYICQADNGKGQQTNHTFLKVLEPPRIKVPPQDQNVRQGDTVSFECEARGSLKVKTSWLFNAKPVFRGATIAISETTLTLSDVQPAQTGYYQCVAESKLGSVSSIATLKVRPRQWNSITLSDSDSTTRPQAIAPDYLQGPSSAEEPFIQIGPSNATVSPGQSVTLLCVTRGDSKISWLKDGRVIIHAVNKRHEVRGDGSLVIDDVQQGDSGVYKCVASNQVGLTTAYAYLYVTDVATNTGPSQIPPTRKDMPPIRRASTTPGPEDRLYNTQNSTRAPRRKRPNQRARPTEASQPSSSDLSDFGISADDEEEDSDLEFPLAAEEGEDGEFPLQPARRDRERGGRNNNNNGGGEGRKQKKKKKKKKNREKKKNRNENGGDQVIMVPPSQPRVSQQNERVVLEWVVPNNDGLRIRFFRVQYKLLSVTRASRRWETIDEDIPNSARRYEVKGLQDGQYRFRIAAVYSNNDNKFGTNSARFTVGGKKGAKTPSDGPFIVDVTASPSAISIRWKNPRTRDLTIDGYHIYFKPFDSPNDYDRRELKGNRLDHYIITNLKPDTQYEIKMQLYNKQGVSMFSNAVSKKTTGLKGQVYPVEVDGYSEPKLVSGGTDMPSVMLDDSYPATKSNSQNSTTTLYMVLGIVLGVMMLLLVIFMITCGWKQRQQRRATETVKVTNDSTLRGKHADSSHRIHGDNIRKKYMNNGFVLNGLNSPNCYPNGTLSNGYPNGTLQSLHGNHQGSKINISVNPMTHVESGNLDGNENEKIQANGDLLPNLHHIVNPNVTDGIYNSLQRNMNRHQFPIIMDHNPSPFADNINRMDTFPAMNRARAASTFKPEAPDPNKIHNRAYDHLNHNGPYDHVYRSHDQIPLPYEHLAGNGHHDLSFMSEPPPPPMDSPSAASTHSHRRRHRRHHNNLSSAGGHRERSHSQSTNGGSVLPSRDGARTPMRDMSTNTDFGQNVGQTLNEESCMDPHGMSYRSLDAIRREEMMHHQHPNQQHSHSRQCRSPIVYPDIPQVHDYSDYNLEDPDLP